jgi:hypothetical protein
VLQSAVSTTSPALQTSLPTTILQTRPLVQIPTRSLTTAQLGLAAGLEASEAVPTSTATETVSMNTAMARALASRRSVTDRDASPAPTLTRRCPRTRNKSLHGRFTILFTQGQTAWLAYEMSGMLVVFLGQPQRGVMEVSFFMSI